MAARKDISLTSAELSGTLCGGEKRYLLDLTIPVAELSGMWTEIIIDTITILHAEYLIFENDSAMIAS